MIQKLLDDLFDNGNIEEESRAKYLVLADHYGEEKTYKLSHFKKLKKRFKKELEKECK